MTNVMYGVIAGLAMTFGFPFVIYVMSLFLGLLFGPGIYFWTSFWLIVMGLAVGSMVTELRDISSRKKSNA